MIVKQVGPVLVLLWIVGCTLPDLETITPTQEVEQKLEIEHEFKQALQQEQARELAVKTKSQNLTPSLMLASLEEVASMEENSIKQRVKQLQSNTTELTAGERFELALLLSQKEGADEKSLKQAQQLFKHLKNKAKNPGVQEILRLQQRNLSLEKQVRKERKKLEQELEESNKRMNESLSQTNQTRSIPEYLDTYGLFSNKGHTHEQA
ncbi:MAG: hypothetical protein P8179_04355 [Candidatus Thiodiazotropha sp.]